MPGKIGFLVIDTVDPSRLAPFWCALLAVEVISTLNDGQYVVLSPTDGGLTISFQRVSEAKTGKNRLHLDLLVHDLDESTAEIEGLDGRWREPGTTRDLEGFTWRCMADPEDNEFDIALIQPTP
jgi:hypothetical protein